MSLRAYLVFHLLVLNATLAGTGCSTTPPEPAEYLLRPSLENGRTIEQPPIAALGQLSVAPYLNRQGIVLETGEGRLEMARSHRWAEPLAHSLRRMLRMGIAQASGRAVAEARSGSGAAPVVIDVDIHRLHGSLEGEVVLAADWLLRDGDSAEVLGRYGTVHRVLTKEDGYPALVRAHAELLDALSASIADTVTALQASHPK